MNTTENKQKGISILGVLLLGVILILVLSYFNISIKAVVESPTGQDNIEYVAGGAKNLWTEYLREPVMWFWEEIWLKIFWEPFLENMERIKAGKPTSLEEAARGLQINN